MMQSMLHTMLGTSWADSPLYFCDRKSAITLKKELDCRDGCGYASEINGVSAADAAVDWIAEAESMMGVKVDDGKPAADLSTAPIPAPRRLPLLLLTASPRLGSAIFIVSQPRLLFPITAYPPYEISTRMYILTCPSPNARFLFAHHHSLRLD